MTLDELGIGDTATVIRMDESALGEAAARRLRAMGVEAGAEIQPVQRGVLWSQDPLAIRVGRTVIALRRAQAASIEVEARA